MFIDVYHMNRPSFRADSTMGSCAPAGRLPPNTTASPSPTPASLMALTFRSAPSADRRVARSLLGVETVDEPGLVQFLDEPQLDELLGSGAPDLGVLGRQLVHHELEPLQGRIRLPLDDVQGVLVVHRFQLVPFAELEVLRDDLETVVLPGLEERDALHVGAEELPHRLRAGLHEGARGGERELLVLDRLRAQIQEGSEAGFMGPDRGG